MVSSPSLEALQGWLPATFDITEACLRRLAVGLNWEILVSPALTLILSLGTAILLAKWLYPDTQDVSIEPPAAEGPPGGSGSLMKSELGQFSRGARRFALPVVSAWFLQVGIAGLIQGVGSLLRTGVAETVNFVIRRGFHDMIEISVQRWSWPYYATIFPAGVVFLALGLAVAYRVAQRRPADDRQQKAPA